MKKVISILSVSVILFTLLSTVSIAQGQFGVVGKIFTKQEANTLYGGVVNSITINKRDLQKALDRAGDYVLLGIKNNRIIIRNERKQPLGDEFEFLERNFTLYRFSKSMLQRLLQSQSSGISTMRAGSDNISVEMRSNVLTLSSEFETLELALPCPPWCQD